jgi:hypothetical protein
MSDGPDGLISVLCKIVFTVDAALMLCSSIVITGRSPVDIFPLNVESVNGNVTSAPQKSREHTLMQCVHLIPWLS